MNTKSLNKFNNLKLAVVAAFAVAGAAISAPALAAAQTATATTGATVIKPIVIASTENLNFGSFAADTNGLGGTVTVSTNAARVGSADVVVTTASAAAVTAAKFDVTGENNATYSISVTDTNLTSGINTMNLATILTVGAPSGSTESNAGTATGTLSGTGAQSFYVGGVLTVGATQAVGTYAGTISATVNYN